MRSYIKPTCNFSIEKRHRPLRLLRGERHAVHPPGAGILPPTGLRGDLHDHAGPGTRFNALENCREEENHPLMTSALKGGGGLRSES